MRSINEYREVKGGAMSNYTVSELLAWMDGKSKTYGWDALVVYDRRKTNMLLHQQYVERFNSDSTISPLTIGLPSSEYTTEYLHGLKLGVPKLSFANANLQSSKADLTMDMVGGLIVSVLKAAGVPERVVSIKQVLPLGGPQLTMTLPLESTPGTVTEGKVTLDISKGEDIRANFVIGDFAQKAVGLMFKVIFQSLDPEKKVFSLGTLNGELNDVLTPQSFQVRTMASPLGDRKGDVDYGNGGVLMFITFKGGFTGSIPPTPDPGNPYGFRYLIPKDEAGNIYTGAMLLSNRVFFDRVIGEGLKKRLGNETEFEAYSGNSNEFWHLTAKSGSISVPDFRFQNQAGPPASCKLTLLAPIFRFFFAWGGQSLSVNRSHNGLLLSWGGANASQGRVQFFDHQGSPPRDRDYFITLRFPYSYKQNFKAVVDKRTGVIDFQRDPESRFVSEVSASHWFPNQEEHLALLKVAVNDTLVPVVDASFRCLELPSVNTLLARNLLFSGTDAFQLTDAYVPGDLALFGHIDPVRTSMTLTPSQSLIEAGKTQQFEVSGDGVSNLLWSVQDTDGDTVDIGTISPAGLYRAPSVSALGKGYVTVLVTAEGRQNNKAVKASALVSIIDSTIAVNPVFQVLAAGEATRLSADTIDGSAPEWTLLQPEQGATLTPHKDNPHHRLYTAGPKGSSAFTLDEVQVKAVGGAPKRVKVLTPNRPTTLTLRVADSSNPASGEVQLQVLVDDEVVDPEVNPYTLTLLDGGGELDARVGIYKEPNSKQTSFAIITVAIGSGTFGHYGFLVLPLPLGTYSAIPEIFNEDNPSAAWRDVVVSK